MRDAARLDNYLELRLEPRWPYIACVRKFIAGFFLIGLSDKERAEQISMAASELLENAIKYASEDDTRLRLEIRRQGNEIIMKVENPADPPQINVLRREFALINAGDPEEIYLRRMEEAAKTGGQSRLGLIRIRFEAGARLELTTREREVEISAHFAIEEA